MRLNIGHSCEWLALWHFADNHSADSHSFGLNTEPLNDSPECDCGLAGFDVAGSARSTEGDGLGKSNWFAMVFDYDQWPLSANLSGTEREKTAALCDVLAELGFAPAVDAEKEPEWNAAVD